MTDSVIIIVYLVAATAVGVISGLKEKSAVGYFRSEGDGSVFTAVAVLTSGFIGGGFSVGNASGCFEYGVLYSFALCGFSVGMIFFARRVIPKASAGRGFYGMITDSYGESASRFTAFFSVIFCLGLVAAQLSAMSVILSCFFTIPDYLSIMISALVVTVYSTVGGFTSVVKTDKLHFAVLSVGIPLLFVFTLFGSDGATAVTSFKPLSFPAFAGLFISFATGEMITPMLVTRISVAKDRKKLSTAIIISSLAAVAFFIMTGLVGARARTSGLTAVSADALISAISAMPNALRGLVGAAMCAVLLSSADAALNCASEAVSDKLPCLRQDKRGYMVKVRLINILLGTLAAAAVCVTPDVTALLMLSYKYWSPVTFSQLLAALKRKKGSAAEFLLPAYFGVMTVLIWDVILQTPYGIPAVAPGVIMNILAYSVIKTLPKTRKRL